ncbi:putative zinc finger protein [Tumebacillus sp. BK434]|uniref:zf-HC2 domain-containing protein n=1 Tax=Tumebacillus sp. BK434 TaxID=2512169 RepID=UPI00105094B0|nr:zf-HC2 domain-containing protein [Tumebacillus sp. BK434]TCP57883.1 putative zinc finger protein [Tumebacillus sp. BK434]
MEQHVLDDLSAYMDQELLPEDEARVRSHLEECASCREVYQELSAVSLAFRQQWGALEPSADLDDRIWLTIQAVENSRERKSAWVSMGSLVACLLLITGFLFSPWGVILSRSVFAMIGWLWTGLSVLAAVVTLSPYVVGGSLVVAVCLLVGSVWSVRKLVTGFSTGEMV